jgi:hypothetical protein
MSGGSSWEEWMRSMLGLRVRVVINLVPEVAHTGELRAFDSAGQVQLVDEVGDFVWCWPALSVVEVSDAE